MTLSGGRRLTQLVWRPWRDGIWRTRVSGPSLDCYGATIYRSFAHAIRTMTQRFDPSAGSPETLWTPHGSSMVQSFWRGHSRSKQRALGKHLHRDQRKDADGKLRLAAAVGMNREVQPSESEVFVDNVLEELDAEDEWYLDRTFTLPVLKTPDGKRPEPAEYIAARLETIVNLHGSVNASVHDIRISGINFVIRPNLPEDHRTAFALRLGISQGRCRAA